MQIKSAVPVFRIFDEKKAKEFYIDWLGFNSRSFGIAHDYSFCRDAKDLSAAVADNVSGLASSIVVAGRDTIGGRASLVQAGYFVAQIGCFVGLGAIGVALAGVEVHGAIAGVLAGGAITLGGEAMMHFGKTCG